MVLVPQAVMAFRFFQPAAGAALSLQDQSIVARLFQMGTEASVSWDIVTFTELPNVGE